MADSKGAIYEFDDFRLAVGERLLSRNDMPVPIPSKAFDLLVALVENNGHLVEKETLYNRVWAGQFVEDANLTVQISAIRKALGNGYIKTVIGHGYRFEGDVNSRRGNSEQLVIESTSFSRVTVEHEEENGYDDANDSTDRVTLQGRSAFSSSRSKMFVAAAGLVGLIAAVWFFVNRDAQPDFRQPKLTQLTSSGKVLSATISPDGKFAVFSQKEEGGEALWLRQLDSGSQTQISPPKPLEYVGLTISPDAQSIYASVFSKNEIDTSLIKIPIIGGVSQPIPNVVTGVSVAISPDGKRFSFTASDSGLKETYLKVSDIDGSNSRVIVNAKDDVRYFKTFVSSPLAWSPDGAEVAAAVYEKGAEGSQATIILVNPDDGSERYLSKKRWDNVDNLDWLDSDRLAFIASEEGGLNNQVWILSRQTGEAKQITNELQSYNWLSATNGKLLSVKSNLFTSLRIGDFDENAKTLTNRELYRASELIDLVNWSPSGEVRFASRASGKPEIWQVMSDGSKPNQLTANAHVTYGLAVSPKDGSIIYGSKLNGKSGIWKMDSDGTNLRQLSEGSDHSPDVATDGRIVFQRGFNRSEGVFLTSPNEPTPRLLKESCLPPAISSDGKLSACYFMDWDVSKKWSIALISNDTGALVRTITLPIPVYSRRVRFHPSGKYITQIFSNGEDLNLLLIPVESGEPQIIEGLGKGSSHIPQWSPDGKQLLYPLITETRDAVLLTDF